MKQNPSHCAVRPAARAGQFYESDPQRLRAGVTALIQAASELEDESEPIAVVAPHAGYIFSGAVAAAAYRAIAGQKWDRFLILAPSHFVDLEGAALPSCSAFETPLGKISVDVEAIREIGGSPGFQINDSPHAAEHSIEVQLPFLQCAFPHEFQILPVALGHPPDGGIEIIAAKLGDLLEWREGAGQRWMIIASTDTYHGYDGEACRLNDEKLMELVKTLDDEGFVAGARNREIMACGWFPLAAVMRLASRKGSRRGVILRRSDSRVESGSAEGYVVGYVSAAFMHG